MYHCITAREYDCVQEYIKNLPKSKSEEKKQKKEKRRDKKDHGDRPHSGRQSNPGSSPHIPSKRVRVLYHCATLCCVHVPPHSSETLPSTARLGVQSLKSRYTASLPWYVYGKYLFMWMPACVSCFVFHVDSVIADANRNGRRERHTGRHAQACRNRPGQHHPSIQQQSCSRQWRCSGYGCRYELNACLVIHPSGTVSCQSW